MKNGILAALAGVAIVGALSTGCAYGGVAVVGTDKVVINRNDGFLFGILRKVFVCKVGDAGVTACAAADAP